MEALCPVCRAVGGSGPVAPSASTVSGSYPRLTAETGVAPDLRANTRVFQSLFVAATTVLGAAVLGMIGGWPMGVLGGAALGLAVGGLVSGAVLMIGGLRRR